MIRKKNMQNSWGDKEKYLNQTSERKRYPVRSRHRQEGRATKNLKVTGVCVCVCVYVCVELRGGGGGVYGVSLWTAFGCLRIQCQ
jgi:hypothetical protein